ncbi:MAG: peptidoglycan D,D-transpeptidase FtsI family protein [Streptosporangiaceae bacterium]
MNRAILRLSLACLVMFAALLVNLNYVQGFQASALAGKPGNVRTFEQQFSYQRGSIIAYGDKTNTVIADSLPVKGTDTYRRNYPHGAEYAPVTGYDSIFSNTGIEQAENKELSGTAAGLQVHNLISLFTGKPKEGASVYLTISPRAQDAAYKALASQAHAGAVVALDPSTGAILALASYPTFNPNEYTSLNDKQLIRNDNRYRKDSAQPLLNRAINVTYPPGSTFKIVTSSAAFSTHKVAGVNSTVPAPTTFQLPGSTKSLVNNDGETCGNGNPPIIEAFYLSCNTAFGKLGIRVGGAALHSYATHFGANNPSLTIPLPVSASVIPAESNPDFAALSAIGQFNDAVTPLQEAMFAATIANRGTLMKPYLVQQVQAPDLSTVRSARPTVLSNAVSPPVASDVGQMMTQVVQNPSGTANNINKGVTGVEIAGKTGTAQNGINNTGLDDAVFTCYAPVGNPKIAVGVIIQGGGYGAAAAAPIAAQVIRAYLGIK